MKEVTATNTAWSLGAVSYNRDKLTELWFEIRLDSGERITRETEEPLPDILLAELPPPEPDGGQ